jgi:beta-galactosidase
MVNKRILFLIYLMCNSAFVYAQQATRLINDWEFLKQDLGGIWEAVRPVSNGGPESVPLWGQVKLPHCVNAFDAVDPDLNYYQGPAWYRTQVPILNPYHHGRTLLHFEGAGQKTRVYIDTALVGEHVGGYDEWVVDITEAVGKFVQTETFQKQFNGKIPVSIRTDNSRDVEMIPSDLSDFNIYGGLYRYVNLVYVPTVSIDKIFASAEANESSKAGKLTVRGRFYNPDNVTIADVQVSLIDPTGKVIQTKKMQSHSLPKDDETLAIFNVKKPSLWSVDNPTRYTVNVSLQHDEITSTKQEKIGFRNFKFVDKGPFMLNGKRLLLRGTHRHEDHAAVGAAMTEEMIRTEMNMMKSMGVNFIRLGHYQQSRIVLDLCDSLGILVWEEIPWCRGGLGGNEYKAQAKRMLSNMIEQHYNHPAIIIWGLGNENDWPGDFAEFDKEQIRTFMKELNILSHRLDGSRKTAIRRCNFCKDIVDVYSPSIWAGWYRGIYTEYKSITEKEFNEVNHFLHVEWGGDSHAGRHAENPDRTLSKIATGKGGDERAGDASLFGGSARVSKDGDWSESYICNLIDWHLKEQETMPWLTGSAYWPFKDFSTPVRPDNPVPYVNQKGVVERDFTKKEAYYVFQSWWTTKPMAHIYGHTWPIRWGDVNEQKMVKVYSNCDQAELFLNGKSYGIKKRNGQDFPAAGLRWMLTFNEGGNNIEVVAKQGGIVVKDKIQFTYQTTKWNKPAKLLIDSVETKKGITTIIVKALDDKNVLCLDAINWVRFGITGDGELIDNQGTSRGSRRVQLYNGRAYISIKTNKGKSIVSVQSDGMKTEFLTIDQ